MGFQVNKQHRQEFEQFVEQLGMPYWHETGNPAYKLFLS